MICSSLQITHRWLTSFSRMRRQISSWLAKSPAPFALAAANPGLKSCRGCPVSALHISLFGRFQAQWQGKKLDGLGSGKVGELFCYLLLHRHRFHPREILAELFWPDYSNTLSRKYLRQALWQLQSTLNGSGVPGRSHMLAIEQSFIGVDMDSDFRLDIEDFEQAFALVRDIPGGELNSESASTLKDAVQLYHADLLSRQRKVFSEVETVRMIGLVLVMDGLVNGRDQVSQIAV
jgi:two-component SAPR family response regulator